MSTRIYCDQCGTETSKREALRFSLSGYSANRTSMGQLNDIDIDICPDCAQRFNDQTIGTVHIRRDHRDKLSPYLLEYQPHRPERRPSMTSIITNEIEERYPYPDNGERPTAIAIIISIALAALVVTLVIACIALIWSLMLEQHLI